MSRQDMVTQRRYGDRAGNKWPTKITFLPKYFVHCKSQTIYLIAQLALCCVVVVVVVIFAVAVVVVIFAVVVVVVAAVVVVKADFILVFQTVGI